MGGIKTGKETKEENMLMGEIKGADNADGENKTHEVESKM